MLLRTLLKPLSSYLKASRRSDVPVDRSVEDILSGWIVYTMRNLRLAVAVVGWKVGEYDLTGLCIYIKVQIPVIRRASIDTGGARRLQVHGFNLEVGH